MICGLGIISKFEISLNFLLSGIRKFQEFAVILCQCIFSAMFQRVAFAISGGKIFYSSIFLSNFSTKD